MRRKVVTLSWKAVFDGAGVDVVQCGLKFHPVAVI